MLPTLTRNVMRRRHATSALMQPKCTQNRDLDAAGCSVALKPVNHQSYQLGRQPIMWFILSLHDRGPGGILLSPLTHSDGPLPDLGLRGTPHAHAKTPV